MSEAAQQLILVDEWGDSVTFDVNCDEHLVIEIDDHNPDTDDCATVALGQSDRERLLHWLIALEVADALS